MRIRDALEWVFLAREKQENELRILAALHGAELQETPAQKEQQTVSAPVAAAAVPGGFSVQKVKVSPEELRRREQKDKG